MPVLDRGRSSIALDLRQPEAVEVALRLVAGADALIEGYRPGVMEKFGLGPDACLARNPRLVFGRLTGWGRDGPLAATAGHDINYIALTGALNAIGEAGRQPVPPMNLLGDFGGGAMLLAVGVLAALLEARASGRGQVVDAAMTDGTRAAHDAHLRAEAARPVEQRARRQSLRRRRAVLRHLRMRRRQVSWRSASTRTRSIASCWRDSASTIRGSRPSGTAASGRRCARRWPALFRTRTRDDWAAALRGFRCLRDARCSISTRRRGTRTTGRAARSINPDAAPLPAAAPRFSRTPAAASAPRCRPGDSTDRILRDLGYDDEAIARLHAAGAC